MTMNYKNILPFAALAAMMFSSCEDQIMDWTKDPSKGEVTVAELPLELAEKIERYEDLKNYTDFTLGVGIGLDLYMKDETYRTIANANFDEVTVGYAMKHGPMVESDGSIDFESVDAFITKTKEAGLSTFGHTLVWHQNQNASYLNGLIAPTVIPASGGANALDLSGIQDGSFSGWATWNSGDGITLVEGEGLSSSSSAIKLIAGASSANEWDLQLGTPDVIVDPAHNYEVSFFIKSDQAGRGRISFNNSLQNQYPWMDWYNTGGDWTKYFDTNTQWQQVNITLAPADFANGITSFKFYIDLGIDAGVTYYIDAENIKVIDLDAEPTIVNLITNGDFESGSLDGWSGWGNGSTRAVSAAGEGYGDTGYAMVLTNPTAASNYQAQQVYTFASPLEQGVEYTCTFMVKATTSAVLQVQIQGENYNGDYYGGIAVGTTWIQIQKTIVPSKADRTKFIFDFGETACTYHIDDLVFAKAEGGGAPSGPTIIEKTAEEKAEIIGDALESWISAMLDHYKADIHAWDVVNEPMKGSGDVRDGSDDYTAGEEPDDYFSWPMYLGKDYAVMAFNLARQYGNADDKLFINDYNLEYSPAKLQGLIDYVTYIEAQGATVDGIGTQMHISVSSDKDLISQMFRKLADSGKLIKISELDVRLGTASPTAEQLAAQADMYRYVIDQYREIIPAAQQYGITIWGISDNEQEHEYWLPDESPNLWDANYNRKHAYKGTADGLAGRDVSEDFSGELQY